MKILFVYRFCGLGGVETSIMAKLDALRSIGIEGQALFSESYGSGGHTLAADPRVTVGFDAESVRALLRSGFDAVSVTDYPDFVDLVARIETATPLIFETATSLPGSIPRFHSRLDHPRVEAVVVPASFNRRMVEGALTTEKPVVVIPNPIDEERFSLRPREEIGDLPVRITADHPIVLWIGRLEDEKNPAELMRVGEVLMDAGTDARFLVVGDAYSEAEYVEYRERLLGVVSDGSADRFSFCRSVPHARMPEVYSLVAHSGGCLVSTSQYESAPMIFTEAMSCMCPIVASDVGGVAEMLEDRVTAHLYDLGDIAGAVDSIRELLDGSRAEARTALVTAAKAVVAERNGFGVVASSYEDLVRSLASRPPAPSPSPRAGHATDAPGADTVIAGLVSTIIPVYNRSGLLREAVSSVLAQTYDNIEIIIVDDGSTDDTPAVCDELADRHAAVRVLHLPHQGRAGLAREAGRQVARGEYIQYLDSDDLIMPTKFARMVEGLERNPDRDIAYCYTRRYRIGETPLDLPAERTGDTFEAMLPEFVGQRFWHTSTPLYRRALCDAAGAWSDLLFWEDVEYDLRMAALGARLYHCKEWLTDFRDHELGRLSGSRFLIDPDLLRHAVRGATALYEHISHSGLTYADDSVRRWVDDVRILYRRCGELGLEPEMEDCASIVMQATGDDDPSHVGSLRVEVFVDPLVGALTARPGSSIALPVRVVNESTVVLHGSEFATEVAYHLLDFDGAMVRFENRERSIFDRPLEPGAERTVDLWVRAPEAPGLYYVQIGVMWAGAWLDVAGDSIFVKLLVTDRDVESPWRLHVEEGNEAALERFEDRPGEVRLAIRSTTTDTPWHVQLNHENLWVVEGLTFEVRFSARADQPRRVAVAVSRAQPPWDGLGLYTEIELTTDWQDFELPFVASATAGNARVHVDAGGAAVSVELRDLSLHLEPEGQRIEPPPLIEPARLGMDVGTRPLSYEWGTDRGLPVHRYYLERFLSEHSRDIRGRCLEFQDPQYVPRFGGAAVETLDILHVDRSNPRATLVADLTRDNTLPSDTFDCIVCTHVLHIIVDVGRAIAELFRILEPGGVLLVAVPHISMYGEEYREVWRFTPHGLEVLLSRSFGENVLIRSYGNSLAAAGEIRGLVASELRAAELDAHDPRFPVEVCARAQKQA